jgi:hypothetical protein
MTQPIAAIGVQCGIFEANGLELEIYQRHTQQPPLRMSIVNITTQKPQKYTRWITRTEGLELARWLGRALHGVAVDRHPIASGIVFSPRTYDERAKFKVHPDTDPRIVPLYLNIEGSWALMTFLGQQLRPATTVPRAPITQPPAY